MKNSKLFRALLLCSILLFCNCTPSFDYITNTKEIISTGRWSVSYFFADADKTSAVRNYSFRFYNGGALECKGSNNIINGVWQVAKDIEGNDIVQLQLDTQNDALKQLNGAWKVTAKNMVNIALKEEGHSNGELKINKY